MVVDDDTLGDPQRVANAIAEWASNRFDGPVAVVAASALSGGLDNFVHAFRLEGPSLPRQWTRELVARVSPAADRREAARAETAIQNWCVAAGYPAARVLALLDDDWSLGRPAQIAERAPGTTMLAAMRSAPGQARVLLRRLASLHAQLHELSTDGWPAPQARGVTASRRLALVRARAAKDPGIADALHRVERALDGLQAEPEVVCHGDFHPLNVIVDRSGAAAVVDWTDAALDDRHSDVARTVVLLRSAAVAGGSSLERVLLALIGPVLAFGYLRAYRGLLPVDRDRLLRWEALHLLNGWAQIAAIEDGGFDSSSAGRRFPRWVLRSVQVRLRGALRRAGAQ